MLTALSPELGILPGTQQALLTKTQFQIEKQKERRPRGWRPARSAHLTQAPSLGCQTAQASSSGLGARCSQLPGSYGWGEGE